MILHFAKHDDWCTSVKIDELGSRSEAIKVKI